MTRRVRNLVITMEQDTNPNTHVYFLLVTVILNFLFTTNEHDAHKFSPVKVRINIV
jgi:hypothetical protein